MVCSNCGRVEQGPKHEADPLGDRTMPSGWFSKYVNWDFNIRGCSIECFELAKKKNKENRQLPFVF